MTRLVLPSRCSGARIPLTEESSNLTVMRILLWLGLFLSPALPAQSYQFTFDPANTWTDGTVRIRAFSQGSFKGNFGESGWPYFTQTKLGAGTFGGQDNDPIPARPFLELAHAEFLRTTGTFRLDLDTINLKATVSQYEAERASPDGINLSTTVALNNEPFRTKTPVASYGANLAPFRLPTFHVDKFRVVQKPGARSASIVPLGANLYGVALTFMTTMSFRVQEFGGFEVSFDAPASLVGLLQVRGSIATFGHPTGRGGDNISRAVDIPVSPFSITMLDGHIPPPIFKVTTAIKRLDIAINGSRRMLANGVRL